MSEIDFIIPSITHEYAFTESESIFFEIRTPIPIVDFVEKYIRLTPNYSLPGPVLLSEWQKQILRVMASPFTPEIHMALAVQIGKSFLTELAICYWTSEYGGNVLLCHRTADDADNFR